MCLQDRSQVKEPLNRIAAGFTAFSFGQMLIWAKQKHARYRKEFGDKYPKNRKAMVPFIV